MNKTKISEKSRVKSSKIDYSTKLNKLQMFDDLLKKGMTIKDAAIKISGNNGKPGQLIGQYYRYKSNPGRLFILRRLVRNVSNKSKVSLFEC
jgi:hypothetical protein